MLWQSAPSAPLHVAKEGRAEAKVCVRVLRREGARCLTQAMRPGLARPQRSSTPASRRSGLPTFCAVGPQGAQDGQQLRRCTAAGPARVRGDVVSDVKDLQAERQGVAGQGRHLSLRVRLQALWCTGSAASLLRTAYDLTLHLMFTAIQSSSPHAQPAHPAIHRHPGIVLGVVPRHVGQGVPSQAAAVQQSRLHQPHNVAVKRRGMRAARGARGAG